VRGPQRYEVELRWSGSTGLGWESYDRTHAATAPPAEQVVGLTTGEAHGNAAVLNPEQLLVMAASSCQMLWFLHLAAKARVDVVEYEDAATGLMPTDVEPTRVTEITLRPRIVVASETTAGRVRKLLHTAHEHCYIANSLTSSVAIEPDIQLPAS
jgi:organic hydroperoxide reductase OsmC/OhrA